ncbi:MAG: hypothetical protein AAF363_20740 [Bacteroidota bacterium]
MNSKIAFTVAFFLCLNVSIAQEGIVIRQYLDKIPVEVFDKTQEGITQKELNKLKNQKASKNWGIDEITSNSLRFVSKSLNTIVELLLLERENQEPILLSYVEEDEMLMIETWDLNKSPIEKVNTLPKLTVNDFFDLENQFSEPEQYQKDVFYHLEQDHVMVGLHTNMQPKYYNKNIDYMVKLDWNGEEFLVQKIKID